MRAFLLALAFVMIALGALPQGDGEGFGGGRWGCQPRPRIPAEVLARRPRACGENERRQNGCSRRNGHVRSLPNCMMRIPRGRFLMGAQASHPNEPGYDPDALPDEAPPHFVQMSAFWIHLTEVEAALYRGCVEAGACAASEVRSDGAAWNGARQDRVGHPANGITWSGADAYCRWIGARLPTEAEWEYAARGESGRRYPWGDEPPSCERAHIAEGGENGCGSDATREADTLPKRENPAMQLRGMSGNVWEWTADWYRAGYEGFPSVARDPKGPAEGSRRVQRGGGFTTARASELRAAHRAALAPTLQLDDVGFRCATDDDAIGRDD